VFVFGFVLVALCDSVPSTDYNSALSTSMTIRWSLLVHSGGSDFVCALLAFVTDMCGPLRESDYLFDQFFTHCNYCCTVLVCFVFVVEKPTSFSLLGSHTSSSFRIGSSKD
jgi:hypothetical protein